MALILAIETSCDETAAAVLRGCGGLLASEVWSQASLHAKYGGVVPEVASRNHLAALPELVCAALEHAGVTISEIDAFAATTGPGLPTALLVGMAHAKALAIGCGRPFLAVNHVEGHLFSPFFGETKVPPHLGLVVSGGHTLLVDVAAFGECRVLGSTLDDAAGEAFDKTAKLLGLGYPGGPALSRLAERGVPGRFRLPRPMLNSGDLNFSFSGLKTAVLTLAGQQARDEQTVADICRAFQDAIVEVLATKSLAAMSQTGLSRLVVAGGVGANRQLREKLSALAARRGFEVYYPKLEFCTDNGAMIAFAGAMRLGQASQGEWKFNIRPRWDLGACRT